METKLQRISELMERTVRRVTDKPDAWASFLMTAARLYKYPFEEQILIYAQRQDATACASIELWNKHMRRWVNRGAKGIALLDNSAGRTTLRHVFDVSDTHSMDRVPFRLWSIKKAHQEQVAEELSHQFGDADETAIGFENQLLGIIRNAIQDNMADYLTELMGTRDGSYLADLDELNAGAIFREALTDSISYMVFSRLGLDTKVLPEDLFKDIFNFNTFDTVMQLGGASGDISEMVLRQIERTVKDIERQERDRLAKLERLTDNISGDEKERSGEHGDHIHAAGRLPDTRPDAGRAGDAPHREIRDAKEDVSEESPERDIRGAAAVREAGQPSVGDRPDGAGTGGSRNGTDGTGTGRDGSAESPRPDEMDGADEHDQAPSRGSDTSRPHQQLTLFATIEEQIETIKQAEEEKTSAFFISQAEIDEVLARGSGVEDGKYRIYLYFAEPHTLQDRAEFLKREYGIGGRSHALRSADHSWEDHNGKGIKLTKGSLMSPDAEILLTWSRVAKRIGELITIDRYLSEAEKTQLAVYQEKQAARVAQLAAEQDARDTLKEAAERMADTRHDAEYRYSLGDTVYLGASEYTLLGYDIETVTLSDEKYPLLSKEMPRAEFDRRLRENPLNDGYIARGAEPEAAEETEPAGENDEIQVGAELTIDGRRFVIDSVEAERDKVGLRDVTFADATGFPIFRTEHIVFVRDALGRQEPAPSEEPLQPAWEKADGGEVARVRIDLTPEKPVKVKLDFHITDDGLGHGGAKTKYGFNVAAIRTLQAIDAETRMATAKEQEILSRYVGWGGIPQAFDTENASWASEYAELKGLLTEEEYESARSSTLNAHYTSPTVIKAIYQAIENMGFKNGNVLEPACGIGNFFGLVPESMSGCKLYGVELDGITGRIAKQLYQSANIAVQGFEDANLPDSFFDLAIGNVPFGSYGMADKRYDKNHFLIHDYFFAKTLDKVRPGGIVAFITSKGTLDKKNSAVRKYIAQRADLIGAIRLPNNAFTANAGTQVTSDILFLQKRDRPVEADPDWVHLSQTGDGVPINSYFAENPDMVLGTMAFDDMMYGNRSETTCKPFEDADLSDQLRVAIENIHAVLTDYEQDELEENETESIPADPDVRNFSFALVDGQIYYRENSRMNKIEVSVTAGNRIRGMTELRDCTRRLIEYQLEGYPDAVIMQEQQNLNALYDAFTKKYDLLSSRANKMAFEDDSSYCLLCSLEVIDENGELERKADMFTKRTIKQHTVVTSVDTPSEALAVSLSEKACVDLPYMAGLTGLSEDELIKELEGVIFLNPANQWYETADEYLSGNVREKLRAAKELAENDAAYAANVTALEAVQPQDLTAGEIDVRLGATWLPQEDIHQFVLEFLRPSYYAENKIKVHYSPYTASWNIEGKKADYDGVLANTTFGTDRINAYQIIEQTLNLKDVRIFDKKIDADGKEIRVLNRKETTVAQQKQQQIKDAFREWIWKDHSRRERLVRLYNNKFNSVRPREYDGSHLTFPGINPEITLRSHQVNAIAHILYGGNTLLGHVVGAGKTFEMVAAAMESKRLGLCHKSLFVVPNHLTDVNVN